MISIAKTIKRHLGRVVGIITCTAFAAVGTASAETKSFEFGGGLALTRSTVRTFSLPCGAEGVTAVVKFKRLGPQGAANDIPIIIELREPDTAPDQEGPVAETKTASATRTEQTVVLRSQPSNRGCTLLWRVRVKHANEGPAPSPVSGTIESDFDGRAKTSEGEAPGCIFHEVASKTTNLSSASGFAQGTIEITANWGHTVGPFCFPGPNPIKLKVQLIDPNGNVVETVEAYSSNESRSELPKFKLVYRVKDCLRGRWKLKFTKLNLNEDVKIDRPVVKFTPKCP